MFLTYLVLMSSESDWIKFICCTIAILYLFATGGAFILLYKINEQAQKLYENQLLELQVEQQEKQILQLHDSDQLVKTIRHDMKHYLLN